MSSPNKATCCPTIRISSILLFFIVLPAIYFVLPLTTASAVSFININTATQEQLDELTGIGPTYAKAIIDERPFSSLDDLIKVKGIGEKTLQKIKDQGLACVACPSPPTATTTAPSNTPSDSTTPDNSPPPSTQCEAEDCPWPAGSTTSTSNAVEHSAPSTYPSSLFINEIMPSPQGPDATNEWIEIFNSNNFAVNLEGWQIKDTIGATKTHTFGAITIVSYGFFVLKRQQSKITLQNTGDGLYLLNPAGGIVDTVEFGKAQTDQSYNRSQNTHQWSTTPTPNAKNIITQQMPEVPPRAFATSNAANKNNAENTASSTNASQTANILQAMPKKSRNLIYFILAFIVAIASATFVLYLKHKTEQ